MKTQFEVGDILGDLCDSGLIFPKGLSEHFEVTSYTQIEMRCGGACDVVRVVLKGAGCPDVQYIDKYVVVVDDHPYTAMYSYDDNLNIFTFEKWEVDSPAPTLADMGQATARDDMSPTMEELADLDDE